MHWIAEDGYAVPVRTALRRTLRRVGVVKDSVESRQVGVADAARLKWGYDSSAREVTA